MDYDKILSEKVKIIKPSGIRKFFDIVSERKDAISLGVGEPDFITPWEIRDSAIRAIKKGYTQYTSNKGLLRLRKAIVRFQKERYGLDYDADKNTLVTVGASEAIDLALRALINNGDEILIPMPSYVSYAPIVTLCGGVPVSVPCYMKDDFKLRRENLEKCITDKTKALILPYPNNPTGAIMEKEYLEELAPCLIKNNIMAISDEIYSELTYGGNKHVSIATIPGMYERTIVINGFSKAFAMTGWRLGYVLCAPEILNAVLKIHQYTMLCAPSISQYAAVAALESGFLDNFAVVEEMKRQYDMRRRYCVNEFNKMGLKTFEPKGAFYVFPNVSSLKMTGEEFANRLLDEQNVAVVPGEAFGECGRDFIRVSYAYSMASLEKAISRVKAFIKSHNAK